MERKNITLTRACEEAYYHTCVITTEVIRNNVRNGKSAYGDPDPYIFNTILRTMIPIIKAVHEHIEKPSGKVKEDIDTLISLYLSDDERIKEILTDKAA